MRRVLAATLLAGLAATAVAQEPSTTGPYKVIKSLKVGGEGGWDYINADPAARRLYVGRSGPGRGSTSQDYSARIMAYDLDNLNPVDSLVGTSGNGAIVDKGGFGFASSRPTLLMFNPKTMKEVKRIPYDSGFGPDGIFFDDFNDRVYVCSHPTKNCAVIDAHNGNVLGYAGIGGPPEQGVADGHGTVYVLRQDTGSVAIIDAKTMQNKRDNFPLGDKLRCNGLALDVKNGILFAACGSSIGAPQPMPGMTMPSTATVTMMKTDGTIIQTLPLPAGSDGMAFNPQTMEAFSTGGGKLTVIKENTANNFSVEEILETVPNSRTIAFDPKTGHIATMGWDITPAPPAAPGQRQGRGSVVPGSFTLVLIGK